MYQIAPFFKSYLSVGACPEALLALHGVTLMFQHGFIPLIRVLSLQCRYNEAYIIYRL